MSLHLRSAMGKKSHSKFKVYLLLIASTGVILILLYKTLNDEDTNKSYEKLDKNPPSSNIATLINVNALLSVTQSSAHLAKQKLIESQFHANLHKIKNEGSYHENLLNLSGDEKFRLDLGINKPEEFIAIKKKYVHLDLKGAPPILAFYRKFFPLLQELGANGILIEYEDMFPFEGPLEPLSAHNAYTKSELIDLLQLARTYDLEVIPLIQTFGHMEFLLKLKSYEEVREVPSYPQVICPSNNASIVLIKQIIDQVVSLHKDIKWLHIGSDEVYYIGECNRCQKRMQDFNMEKDDLFIYHVKNVASYVKEKHSIQPIMWDDMFRMVSEQTIKNSEIWKYVDIMAWQYSPSVESKIPPEAWTKYEKFFPTVWVASAFKGATGAKQYLTNISYHLENHVSWLQTISKYGKDVNFGGFVLTGWQRYDHFAVLCELLPVAIPSLALNLIFLKHQKIDDVLLQKTRDIVKCDNSFTITPHFDEEEVLCDFPGSNIFKGAQKLARLKYAFEKLLSNSHFIGWMDDYNVKMLFSSPAHVELATQNIENLLSEATFLYEYMQNSMPDVYDKYTIEEWLQSYIYPLIVKIEKVQTAATNLLKYNSWPRRPLISSDSDKNIIHNGS